MTKNITSHYVCTYLRIYIYTYCDVMSFHFLEGGRICAFLWCYFINFVCFVLFVRLADFLHRFVVFSCIIIPQVLQKLAASLRPYEFCIVSPNHRWKEKTARTDIAAARADVTFVIVYLSPHWPLRRSKFRACPTLAEMVMSPSVFVFSLSFSSLSSLISCPCRSWS